MRFFDTVRFHQVCFPDRHRVLNATQTPFTVEELRFAQRYAEKHGHGLSESSDLLCDGVLPQIITPELLEGVTFVLYDGSILLDDTISMQLEVIFLYNCRPKDVATENFVPAPTLAKCHKPHIFDACKPSTVDSPPAVDKYPSLFPYTFCWRRKVPSLRNTPDFNSIVCFVSRTWLTACATQGATPTLQAPWLHPVLPQDLPPSTRELYYFSTFPAGAAHLAQKYSLPDKTLHSHLRLQPFKPLLPTPQTATGGLYSATGLVSDLPIIDASGTRELTLDLAFLLRPLKEGSIIEHERSRLLNSGVLELLPREGELWEFLPPAAQAADMESGEVVKVKLALDELGLEEDADPRPSLFKPGMYTKEELFNFYTNSVVRVKRNSSRTDACPLIHARPLNVWRVLDDLQTTRSRREKEIKRQRLAVHFPDPLEVAVSACNEYPHLGLFIRDMEGWPGDVYQFAVANEGATWPEVFAWTPQEVRDRRAQGKIDPLFQAAPPERRPTPPPEDPASESEDEVAPKRRPAAAEVVGLNTRLCRSNMQHEAANVSLLKYNSKAKCEVWPIGEVRETYTRTAEPSGVGADMCAFPDAQSPYWEHDPSLPTCSVCLGAVGGQRLGSKADPAWVEGLLGEGGLWDVRVSCRGCLEQVHLGCYLQVDSIDGETGGDVMRDVAKFVVERGFTCQACLQFKLHGLDKPSCVFCRRTEGGILRSTKCGVWLHAACAEFVELLEPVDGLTCMQQLTDPSAPVLTTFGESLNLQHVHNELQSVDLACPFCPVESALLVQCHQPSCRAEAFHVPCAVEAGLYLKERQAFCVAHSIAKLNEEVRQLKKDVKKGVAGAEEDLSEITVQIARLQEMQNVYTSKKYRKQRVNYHHEFLDS